MKKRILVTGLLLLLLAMLLVPGYPVLNHYFSRQHTTISNPDITAETANTLLGDLHYLQALIERSSDKSEQKKTPEPPPGTQNQTTNFVYLLTTGSVQFSINTFLIIYKPYLFKFSDCIIPLDNPPPKALFILFGTTFLYTSFYRFINV